MKKVLLIVVVAFSLILTGCNDSKNLNKNQMSINCNGEETTIDLNTSKEFNCKLQGNDYTFKIDNITNKSLNITASDYGLTKVKDGKISLRDKVKKFTIKKNTEVTLSTQSMDANEKVIIYWN